MPSNLAHARWDAGEADAGRLITGRNVERHGIGVHRPLRRRQFDFVEMRLAIQGGIDAQALHCDSPARNEALRSERRTPKFGTFRGAPEHINSYRILSRAGV